MTPQSLTKAALLALGLTATLLAGWEIFWRSRGFQPTHNDDKTLWADVRPAANKTQQEATAFIGSSRIKFDLDLNTWKKETGEQPVQLALVGTSPRLLLKDLADDEDFKGKVVVDVTEILFFSGNPAFQKSAQEAIAFYHDQTPAQKASDKLALGIESSLTLLEENRFSLNSLLNRVPLPNRPGVFQFPAFPKGFDLTTEGRQTYMSDDFLASSADLKRQTDIWNMLILGDPTPKLSDSALAVVFDEVKTSVEKIRSRGGKVIFVRTPSSGPLLEAEDERYPRNKYWEALLRQTRSEGMHFKDDSVTARLVCPEWSHLSRADAVVYTRQLVKLLKEKDWFASSAAN